MYPIFIVSYTIQLGYQIISLIFYQWRYLQLWTSDNNNNNNHINQYVDEAHNLNNQSFKPRNDIQPLTIQSSINANINFDQSNVYANHDNNNDRKIPISTTLALLIVLLSGLPMVFFWFFFFFRFSFLRPDCNRAVTVLFVFYEWVEISTQYFCC